MAARTAHGDRLPVVPPRPPEPKTDDEKQDARRVVRQG